MSDNYQLMVLGAGPGGYVAAIKAAQLGLHTALVEKDLVGGTCLNRGCIPTKTILHSTELLRELREAEKLGIHADNLAFDFNVLHQRKNEVVSQLRSGIEQLVKANQIDLIRGNATILAANKVRVGTLEYTTEHILIATGSEPSLPPIPGLNLPNVVTSDDLLGNPKAFYQRLVIIGGGVIGVEFAGIFAALDCQVSIIEAMDRILPQIDREVSQNLTMIYKKRGIAINTGCRVEKIEQGENGLICRFSKQDQSFDLEADGVLVAIGRKANTAGLLTAGLDLNLQHGQIPVNDHFETCIPGIYAIGDVVYGSIQLAHLASAQGINAASAIAGLPMPVDSQTVPSCIYTRPEIATVGINADTAKTMGLAVKVGKYSMLGNGKSIIAQADRGFIRIVSDAETGVILGAQLMCERATDMISEFTTAVTNRLTVEQMIRVVRPHPTFNEAASEALEDILGNAIHSAPKRR